MSHVVHSLKVNHSTYMNSPTAFSKESTAVSEYGRDSTLWKGGSDRFVNGGCITATGCDPGSG